MTKTIITPENNNLLLSIPDEYVGKKLEVLIYTVEEIFENKKPNETMSAFKGILTPMEAEQLQEHIKQSRAEWNNI